VEGEFQTTLQASGNKLAWLVPEGVAPTACARLKPMATAHSNAQLNFILMQAQPKLFCELP
jgi:hypothetical protein